jgi:hypothetical protein
MDPLIIRAGLLIDYINQLIKTGSVVYNKNIQFSRLIKCSGILREFNFRKSSQLATYYHVDVSDERGNRFMWTMESVEGGWRIKGGQIPSWILASESLLQAAIQDHEDGKNIGEI